jgi:hypothetical protein
MPGFFSEKIKSRNFLPLLALIAAGLFAYGPQIPYLGLFQDDWHFIHYGSARGALGMLEFLTMDGRPTAAWVYALGFPLLGFSPIRWQILSLTLRLVTVILTWLVLNTLWQDARRTNLLACLIFLLYPFFTLQPQAVVYTEHWMAFALFMGSLLLMLHAVRYPKMWLPFTALAVLAETLQLFTVEYFVGLELLRPFAIWLMMRNTGARSFRENRSAILKNWLPYLLVLLLFIYWRTFFLGGLGLRNDPSAALSLQTILDTLLNIPSDITLILVTSWFKLLDPAALELDRLRNMVILLVSFIGGWAAFIFVRKFFRENSGDWHSRTYWVGGTLAFLLGIAPAYAANFIIHLKLEPWNGRFALAALPAAGMLLAYAFESIFTSERSRQVVFAILIGLLIGWHNRVALDFRTAWEKQVNLYQQLVWRAPSLEAGTAIITDQEILGYMGDYPTSFAINTIYDTRNLRPSPYWFFAMSENLKTDPASLAGNTPLRAKKYASTFYGESWNSLIIVFEPEKDQCLWILRPEDADYRNLPAGLKTAAAISNLGRIQPESKNDFHLYHTIVPEDRDSWCYYYQRADLARQMNRWTEIITIWDDAEQAGHHPGNGFEYIPFIQANAYNGDWDAAQRLTKQSNRSSQSMKTILCPVWHELQEFTPDSLSKLSAIEDINDLLDCQFQ